MDLHKPVPNKTYEEMTREERLRFDHQKMHEKHKGHDAMHLEMILILLVTLIIAQILLVQWKQRHYRSYSLTTLIALWLIPIVVCLKNFWWRFTISWVVFTLISLIVMRKANTKPVSGSTPRLVYKWFNFIYKLSYGLGIIGYSIMLMAFFGINLIFSQPPQAWMDVGLMFAYYGLYFGVLGRDLSEICTDKLACNIGYYHPKGLPTRQLEENICAVCGHELVVKAEEEGLLENSYKLPCNHVFHEFCIRGWCIIGKKQTCPYCKEKVDLARLFKNPWERPHLLYGQLLDWVRYLVAWQPLILGLVQGINYALGLESLFE
ncbi:hypothetical protein HA402_011409 [Bradysia odoriphaga]|nr:hypothetical protein HA402_011409 [Bradysia odoriphaga]